MDRLPEFVTDAGEERQTDTSPPTLTGWETVVFQLDDEPESDFSTAAIAP